MSWLRFTRRWLLTKPSFGEQSPHKIAKVLWSKSDPEWCSSYVWFKKTGKPPKDYGDYTYHELLALLVETERYIDSLLPPEEESEEESKTVFNQKRRIGPPTLGVPKWETAHRTGDPQIDKWERDIASGLDPDLG